MGLAGDVRGAVAAAGFEKYTDAKSPALWAVVQEAERWAALSGWAPEPTDV